MYWRKMPFKNNGQGRKTFGKFGAKKLIEVEEEEK